MLISGTTGLTGLFGRPVSHSISPMMHNLSFEELGLDYVYLCFDIGEEELDAAVNGMVSLGARGWNCTMPDKNRMSELCDVLSPAAKVIGAANTVVNENGRLFGYNTDGTGYMRSVADAGFSVTGEKMTVLGAGGAATSIFVQAALDGVREITIFSRPGYFHDRAEGIIRKLSKETSCRISLFDYSDEDVIRRELKESRLLVNGTNVGMAPDTDRSVITDASMLHPDLIVSDVIYNPRETKLLKMARENGCAAFNGLYMLLYQGAEAFYLWTGKDMPVALVKKRYFDAP